MDGHPSSGAGTPPAGVTAAGNTTPPPSTSPPLPAADLDTWRQEARRLKATLQQVLTECAAMQDELKRGQLDKVVLVEKLKAMEHERAPIESLHAQLREMKARAEQDGLLIERLQSELRQAILDRAQVQRDLFEAHTAVDQITSLLDSSVAPSSPVESK